MTTGYPPFDTPKPLAAGVWVVDSEQTVGLFRLPIRMTILRLSDGGLWLHSPTPHGLALHQAVAALGPIRHLVAPDTAHWMHLRDWQMAAPDATSWGAPGLAARLAGKAHAPRLDIELGPEAPPDWAGEIEQARFTAPGFAEIAFHHRPTGTLVLTDTVQAMDPARLTLPTRLFGWATASAGEGAVPAHLRLLLRSGAHRAGNRAAAEKLLALAPQRVIFAHGTPFEQDATARLSRAFSPLLRP